jgi:hypothetical protein
MALNLHEVAQAYLADSHIRNNIKRIEQFATPQPLYSRTSFPVLSME